MGLMEISCQVKGQTLAIKLMAQMTTMRNSKLALIKEMNG